MLSRSARREIVTFEGERLRLIIRPGTGDTLLILFHGATSRDRPFPQYQALLPLPFPQISLVDPGMDLHANLATSWYLGGASQNLPQVLPAFFNAIAAELGTTRKIFVGGSAGGFAALFYARQSGNDALAIASCPQIDLTRYRRIAVESFRKICFPEAASLAELAARVPLDLSPLYGQEFRNHVILLLSAGDRHHLSKQLAPLLQAISEEELKRVLVEVGFWGRLEHSGSVPSAAWLPWVKRAAEARDWSADALMLAKWEELNTAGQAAKPPERRGAFLEADLQMAAVLNRHMTGSPPKQ